MFQYEEKKFTIPDLKGLSEKQLTVHLGLYAGYVKHVNLLREKIHELEAEDREKHAYTISELRRRFGFEFDGMRMHEYYFEQFEHGSTPLTTNGTLQKAVSEKYGSWESFLEHFATVGMTRGVGWSVLYCDPRGKTPASPYGVGEPHTAWIGDHELGVLAGLPVILAMDMWEHAFMVDYTPSEKKKYIDAFFENLNWGTAEKRLDQEKT